MRGARHDLGATRSPSARPRCCELVGIDPIHLQSYPHQLSGGMRQRAMIAMALLFTPDLVIMDEPTSALDVVAQRSLMVQIKELQQRLGFAVVFVTHDMSLVSHFSDRLLVMYAGQVVEAGPTRDGLRHARAPVQPGAARRVPVDPRARGCALTGIPGSPPDLAQPADRLPLPPALPGRRMPQCADRPQPRAATTAGPSRGRAACCTRRRSQTSGRDRSPRRDPA